MDSIKPKAQERLHESPSFQNLMSGKTPIKEQAWGVFSSKDGTNDVIVRMGDWEEYRHINARVKNSTKEEVKNSTFSELYEAKKISSLVYDDTDYGYFDVSFDDEDNISYFELNEDHKNSYEYLFHTNMDGNIKTEIIKEDNAVKEIIYNEKNEATSQILTKKENGTKTISFDRDADDIYEEKWYGEIRDIYKKEQDIDSDGNIDFIYTRNDKDEMIKKDVRPINKRISEFFENLF